METLIKNHKDLDVWKKSIRLMIKGLMRKLIES